MILNTHIGGAPSLPVAVGEGLHSRPGSPSTCFVCDSPPVGHERAAMRPGVVAHLFCRAGTPLVGSTAERRVVPTSNAPLITIMVRLSRLPTKPAFNSIEIADLGEHRAQVACYS